MVNFIRPDPIRGSGRVYPRIRIDPQFPTEKPCAAMTSAISREASLSGGLTMAVRKGKRMSMHSFSRNIVIGSSAHDHASNLACWIGLQRRQRSISQSPDDRCWCMLSAGSDSLHFVPEELWKHVSGQRCRLRRRVAVLTIWRSRSCDIDCHSLAGLSLAREIRFVQYWLFLASKSVCFLFNAYNFVL